MSKPCAQGGGADEDCILYADIDFALVGKCAARKHFLRDRRPEIYPL